MQPSQAKQQWQLLEKEAKQRNVRVAQVEVQIRYVGYCRNCQYSKIIDMQLCRFIGIQVNI